MSWGKDERRAYQSQALAASSKLADEVGLPGDRATVAALNRIAKALERLAAAQEELTVVEHPYRRRRVGTVLGGSKR